LIVPIQPNLKSENNGYRQGYYLSCHLAFKFSNLYQPVAADPSHTPAQCPSLFWGRDVKDINKKFISKIRYQNVWLLKQNEIIRLLETLSEDDTKTLF